MIEKWGTPQPLTRCPLDGKPTHLDASIYADPATTKLKLWGREGTLTDAPRHIGTILGCGHVLATDRWAWRIALDEEGKYVGWWTDPGSRYATEPVPDDAVRVKADTTPSLEAS